MTIKTQTLEQIEQVLKQNKKYYRSNEFGFPTNKNGYSTHQGAVLRKYLRENGYVNVRVSEIKTQFFIDNADSIKAGIKSGPKGNIFLKPSNTIIIKAEDYLKYTAGFTFENFKKNLLQYPIHDKPNGLKPVTLNNKPVIVLLVDKYSKKLKTISAYYDLNKDDLPLNELSDLEQKIRDLAEIVQDLTSIL